MWRAIQAVARYICLCVCVCGDMYILWVHRPYVPDIQIWKSYYLSTCAHSYFDCSECCPPKGNVATLFVHVVEVFMQREKLPHTDLSCWLRGSGFYKAGDRCPAWGSNSDTSFDVLWVNHGTGIVMVLGWISPAQNFRFWSCNLFDSVFLRLKKLLQNCLWNHLLVKGETIAKSNWGQHNPTVSEQHFTL